jgi:galactokinase
MINPADLTSEFEARFGRTPRCYRAPGRVNLIGEHTDYNDGFVMPMAVDRSTWVAAAPRRDRTLVVHSREYAETVTMSLDAPVHQAPADNPSGGWTDYVRGVAAVLDTSGADMLIASDVPIGAGLSSSAALEIAAGYALLDLASDGKRAGTMIDLTALALACQRAEHAYVGARCGVMDQMIACHGRTGHAMMLDTRSLACRWLPLPDAVRVIVCNTMVKHQHAAGEYNARRADCEAGVRVLNAYFPHVQALRDAASEELVAAAANMSDRLFRRCRHVIGENMRVDRAARALMNRDFIGFGELMAQSHASLRDDYEVSCSELDAMVRIASRIDGIYGARMTGGGFGGCAIALADADRAAGAAERIALEYEREIGVRSDVWISAAGPGVGIWN